MLALNTIQAPLIRYEQKQKDFDDSWETETVITTFDLDEIETEIEVDYWVSFCGIDNLKFRPRGPDLNLSTVNQMKISI